MLLSSMLGMWLRYLLLGSLRYLTSASRVVDRNVPKQYQTESKGSK